MKVWNWIQFLSVHGATVRTTAARNTPPRSRAAGRDGRPASHSAASGAK